MAINPNPDPVLCADRWRHRGQSVGPSGGPPPATTVVFGIFGNGRNLNGSPRCDPCVRSLAAASADAVLVDVVDLGPFRVSARYDADTATPV